MNEYIEPRGGWKTFNDFFARSTKPGYRPIDSLCDSNVIVSPADSTLDGSWPVTASSHVNMKNIHRNIQDLLKGGPYSEAFEGGIFMHSFLNTYDYHRQHPPMDGKVVEARNIAGQVYLEVKVVEDPETGKPNLHGECHAHGKPDISLNATVSAPDDAGYQFLQCRGLIVLETEIGLIAVLAMGLAQVSSVIINAEVWKYLRKGEEISFFQLGGSELTAGMSKHYNMGEKIGVADTEYRC